MPTPEAIARQNIDAQLAACGWTVQDRVAMNLYAARGVETVPSGHTLYRCPLCRAFVVGFDRENHVREKHEGQKVDFTKPG